MLGVFRVQSLEFTKYLTSSLINFLCYRRKIRESSKVGRILVIKTDYLGDMVMSTGVFSTLRESFPDAQMALLTNSQMATVFRNDRNFNRVMVYDPKFYCTRAGKRYSLVQNLPLLRELRKERFDLIVDLSSDPLTIILTLTYAFRAYRVERDTLRTKDTFRKHWRLLSGGLRRDISMEHEVLRHQQILNRAGIRTNSIKTYFPLDEQGQEEADHFIHAHELTGYTIIQPGSHWSIRRWAPEKFARLGDGLIDLYELRVVLSGSSAERELLLKVKSLMDGEAVLQVGELSIQGLAALVRGAQLFVGNDSGPAHIAAALGVPTVAIMGTADIERYRPYGPRTEICYRAVRCGPCYAGGCYMPENICLQPVEVEEVLEKVDRLLNITREFEVAPH
jgi:ADP-heptose:LPS heptosyltransferase